MKKKNYIKSLEEKIANIYQKRKKLEATVIKRRKFRDKIKKEIAEREGVNIKRVVLMSKDGSSYTVKVKKEGVVNIKRKEARQSRYQKFLKRITNNHEKI